MSLFTRRKSPTIPPQVSLFTRRKCPYLPAARVLLSYSTLVDYLQRCGNPTTARLGGFAAPSCLRQFTLARFKRCAAKCAARHMLHKAASRHVWRQEGLAAPRCSNPDRILQRIGRKKGLSGEEPTERGQNGPQRPARGPKVLKGRPIRERQKEAVSGRKNGPSVDPVTTPSKSRHT